MTSTLQISPQAQLEEVSTTEGRFARQPLTIAWPDPEPAPVRSARVARMQARVQYRDYQIDPAVLAEAIIDHVCLR
jgi:anti-sigma28 factor (negative regulator of flagellin synthesis)